MADTADGRRAQVARAPGQPEEPTRTAGPGAPRSLWSRRPPATPGGAERYDLGVPPAARQLVPEVMDDPGLSVDLHEQALDGLRRLNAVSRSAATVWPMIRDAGRQLGRPVRVLDLACGGGDVLLKLGRRAHAAGLDLRLTGWT